MARRVLEEQAGEIRACVVWVPMLPGDTHEKAVRAARIYDGLDVEHFYDRERLASETVARALGWYGKRAWDVYLLYGEDARWVDESPAPLRMTHQLEGRPWASPERYSSRGELPGELARMLSG